MFKDAKIGDKVYSLRFGYGIISEIKPQSLGDFPVIVTNKKGNYLYTYEGFLYLTDLTPDLYWDKPEIIAPKRKITKILTGYTNLYSRPNNSNAILEGNISCGGTVSKDLEYIRSLSRKNKDFIATGKVTIEYQVEE